MPSPGSCGRPAPCRRRHRGALAMIVAAAAAAARGGVGAHLGDRGALGGGDLVLGHAAAALDQRGGVGAAPARRSRRLPRGRGRAIASASPAAAADFASYSAAAPRPRRAAGSPRRAGRGCRRSSCRARGRSRAGTFFHSISTMTTIIASDTQAVAFRPSAVGSTMRRGPPCAAVEAVPCHALQLVGVGEVGRDLRGCGVGVPCSWSRPQAARERGAGPRRPPRRGRRARPKPARRCPAPPRRRHPRCWRAPASRAAAMPRLGLGALPASSASRALTRASASRAALRLGLLRRLERARRGRRPCAVR